MKKFLETISKKVKLKTLIILLVLLLCNTYAWFIYATKVSGGIAAHVSSWNIQFQAGEEETTTNITFDVDRIYPGMKTYTETIRVYNNGEMDAKLTYKIKSVKILGQTYQLSQGTTLEELLDMLENDFPFSINIIIDNETLASGGGTGSFTFSLEWPFESNNDELDTMWGEKSYEYYVTHPDEKSINLLIEISAIQIED